MTRSAPCHRECSCPSTNYPAHNSDDAHATEVHKHHAGLADQKQADMHCQHKAHTASTSAATAMELYTIQQANLAMEAGARELGHVGEDVVLKQQCTCRQWTDVDLQCPLETMREQAC